MKTLKKTLCLVLAVVMAVGVLILPANAATFTDKASVSKDYTTAVTALINYGILQGKKNGNELTIDPQGKVTRAEVATMAYRMLTGDTAGAYVNNYVNYANVFSDVKADWQRGPVGFAANGKLVVGIGGDLYAPNANVTGYELLAIMLRALGYGQLGEFTGAKWKENTYAQAVKSGLDEGVKKVDLSSNLTREQVAQIIYNTITASRVVYTPGLGYTYVHGDPLNTETNKNNWLVENGTIVDNKRDDWGAPKGFTHPYTFTWPVDNVDAKWTETLSPVKTYHQAVTECKVYEDTGVKGLTDTYTNGAGNTGHETIEITDEVHTIGAQGRVTDVYKYYNPITKKDEACIVYKDTVLAVVTASYPALYDTANHLVQDAKTIVTVYGNNVMQGLYGVNFDKTPTTVAIPAIEIDGVQLAKGTVLTANVFTDKAARPTDGKHYNLLTDDIELDGAAAATPVTVTVTGIVYDGANKKVIGFEGSDGNTYLYDVTYGYCTVNGAVVSDNPVEKLGNAAIGQTYSVYVTSYTDDNGNYNVLGVVPQVAAYNVGVVTNVAKVSVGTDENGDTIYAQQLTILTADGNTTTISYIGNNHPAANKTGNYEETNLKGKLISYTTNPKNTKYSNVYVGKDFSHNRPVRSGVTDTISATAKVDDSTVFFIETYTMSLSKGGYVTNSYDVIKGFKNIPNLIDGISVWDSDNDKLLVHNTMEFYTIADPDHDGYADYVLIKYGTESSTNTPKATNQYAYIDYDRQMTVVHDTDYTFNAVVDGATTSLVVKSLQGKMVQDNGPGLYIYGEYTNGAIGKLSGPVNHILPTYTWTHVDGVIDLGAGNTIAPDGVGAPQRYFTVVDNCPIHIVNPTTGAVMQTAYGLDVIALPVMYADADIYFELNEYGWIDRIYVINDMKTPSTGGTVDVPNVSYTVFFAQDTFNYLSTPRLNYSMYVDGKYTETTKVPGGRQYTDLTSSTVIKVDGLRPETPVALQLDNSSKYFYGMTDEYGVLEVPVAKLYVALGSPAVDKTNLVTIKVTDISYDAVMITVKYPDTTDADGKTVVGKKDYQYFSNRLDTVDVKVDAGYVVDTISPEKWDPTKEYKLDTTKNILTLSPNGKSATFKNHPSSIVVTMKEAPEVVDYTWAIYQTSDSGPQEGTIYGSGTWNTGKNLTAGLSDEYAENWVIKSIDKIEAYDHVSGALAATSDNSNSPAWYNDLIGGTFKANCTTFTGKDVENTGRDLKIYVTLAKKDTETTIGKDTTKEVGDGDVLEVKGAVSGTVEVGRKSTLKAGSIEKGSKVTMKPDSIIDVPATGWHEAITIEPSDSTKTGDQGEITTDNIKSLPVGIYAMDDEHNPLKTDGQTAHANVLRYDFADAYKALSNKDSIQSIVVVFTVEGSDIEHYYVDTTFSSKKSAEANMKTAWRFCMNDGDFLNTAGEEDSGFVVTAGKTVTIKVYFSTGEKGLSAIQNKTDDAFFTCSFTNQNSGKCAATH